MTPFMGTHLSRLDGKGRISVPAGFRTLLRADGADGTVVLRPSHQYDCIEGWPMAIFAALAAPLEQMDVFSRPREDFASTLYAEAVSLEADADGRIVLPDYLVSHAKLADKAAFMGVGDHFLIWEPGAAETYKREARARTRDNALTLAGRVP